MPTPSPAELLLLALSIAASAAIFWKRFGIVLRTIRASRPDSDFSLSPLAPRLRHLFLDVLCQAKVIRGRPLPGLAHAFVFWGFCAFALITLNHFAQAVGLAFLNPRQGLFGPIYYFLAAAFAIAVSLSITGLAIRRFLIRPKWLGDHVSLESGLIAFLILLLMLTFLADYLSQPSPAISKALWWTHTLPLLVFLPLLPHTKHLHLILSPAAVFLSRGQFSKIPPLVGDEDFGLDTGRDVTQLLALQAYSCVECGRCQQHCPAHNTGKELNPKQLALGLRAYLNENGANSESQLLGNHLSETAVFQCTTCGACETQCPVGVQHLPLIVGLRRGAVNTGRWEDEFGGELFLKLERSGNPLGMAAIERDRFIQKNALPLFDGTQEYCLWLGCMGSYDPHGRETVLALVQLLRHAGITFGVLRKEKCTGDSARRLGNDLAFQQLAEFNIQQLQAVQAAKLLSICPHCVRTIREDWREFGVHFEIEHHSVLLARLNSTLPASQSQEKIVYHDPCYLGRYQDVYQAPRDVVRASGELLEAPRHGQTSFCCGAGGGLVYLGEEQGTRISQVRARELTDTGAATIAAACPFCHTMFRDALAGTETTILDIAQLTANRIPKP
ncbi:MAG: (Fe-S)-binding protein [Acidobacteria bacterium]|nr:(Fe-S)-binding protein [Acidobacteriota bacterium]